MKLNISGNPDTKPKSIDDLSCMPGFDDIIPTSDKCYFISSVDDYQTWDDALAICDDMIDYSLDVGYTSQNTQLVSINSNAENNQLFDELTSLQMESAWIGLSWSGKKFNYQCIRIVLLGEVILLFLVNYCCKHVLFLQFNV